MVSNIQAKEKNYRISEKQYRQPDAIETFIFELPQQKTVLMAFLIFILLLIVFLICFPLKK